MRNAIFTNVFFATLIVLLAGVAGCESKTQTTVAITIVPQPPTATPQATATAEPTEVPTEVPTETPVPTQTATPTPAPTQSATRTQTSTPSPTPIGPIIVNTTDDPGTSSECSLRAAINNANNKTSDANSTCAAGGGNDTITFSVSGTITLTGPLPAIANALTIDGKGHAITVDGVNRFQVLVVNPGATVKLDNLTVSNGHTTFTTNQAGAIYAAGPLTVINSTFSGNQGGAIFAIAPLTVTNSTFSGNIAGSCVGDFGYGGAAIFARGSLTVTDSTFSGNTADSCSGGGAIFLNSSSNLSLTISNSSFLNNRTNSGGGGAIWFLNTSSALAVANCSFSGNSTVIGGNSSSLFSGGALDVFGGTVTVTNSTFSGNTSNFTSGGAIHVAAPDSFWKTPGGVLTVTNSTFSDNSASGTGGGAIGNGKVATVTNSILAGSGVSGNCGEVAVTNGRYNISDDTSCGFGSSTGANGQTIGDNVNPLLDPNGLQDNGGPTETIALQSTRPAIAAIPLANCKVSTDQRGFGRPAPGFDACDIGAYEYNAKPTPTPTPTPTGVVTLTKVVGGEQGPWLFSSTLNADEQYGVRDQLAPTVISTADGISFAPGNSITVTYLSGTVSAGPGGWPFVDANGDVNHPANDYIDGPTGTFPPSRYMPSSDYPVYITELVGTFADSKGAIVGTPFPLGKGPTVLTIPSGATQLQLGAEDYLYRDNVGSWSVSITALGHPVGPTPTATPTGVVTPSFATQVAFASSTNPVSITAADINGDGKPDLIVANFYANSVSVLLNTTPPGAATPSFVPQQIFATGDRPTSVTAVDVNGDGKPDLIVANSVDDTVSVLINTTAPGAAAPSFANQQQFDAGSVPWSVTAADINGDGKPDLIVTNGDEAVNTVSVLLNITPPGAATASFAGAVAFATGRYPLSVTAGDINGDGKPDLIVVNGIDDTVSVLLNTTPSGAATPSFAGEKTFATGIDPFSVTAADINGDGKPDLIVTSFSASSTVSVLLNTTAPGATTPSFAAQQQFAAGAGAASVTAADVNGDGKPDVIVTNSGDDTVSVLFNTTAPGATTPSFAGQQAFATEISPYSVTTADINGDGKPDLIAANQDSNTVSVLLNTIEPFVSTLGRQPPSPPR